MKEILIRLPEEILSATKVKEEEASEAIRKIVALELFRERSISMGKAAEIAGISLAEFMEYSSQKEVTIHYTLEDLNEDRETIERMGL